MEALRSRFGMRTIRTNHRHHKVSEAIRLGFLAARTVLNFGAVLSFGREARHVLAADPQNLLLRAKDVVATGRRVVYILKILEGMAQSAKTLTSLAKECFKNSVRRFEVLRLNGVHDAVCSFASMGFINLKRIFRVTKEAKIVLDCDIRDALEKLRVALSRNLEEILAHMNIRDTHGLEEAIIEAIATYGDDVYRRDFGEYNEEKANHVRCCRHPFEEMRKKRNHLGTRQNYANNFVMHDEHIPVAIADDPAHIAPMLGHFGMNHKIRYPPGDCQVTIELVTSMRTAKCLSEHELVTDAMVLSKLHHEQVVAYYEVRVVKMFWSGKCRAMECVFPARGFFAALSFRWTWNLACTTTTSFGV